MSTPELLEDEIVSALRRIVRAIDLHSRRMVDECGLTGPQIVVLREASRLSGSSISALARAANLGQPTVSGILDRLEAQGLVRRKRSKEDRRSVFVAVTPKGARVLKNAPSLLQDRFRSELSRLEEWERTQILALLQRLGSMMDAEAIDAAPMLETGTLTSPRKGAEEGEPAREADDRTPSRRG
ncbi:MAG: MarR family winged helix-turn-helix transcriptional regulator [Myxococcota bacterium]